MYHSKRNTILNIVIPITLAVLFTIAVVLSGIWFVLNPHKSESQVRIVLNESGIPKLIDGAFSDVKVRDADSLYLALDDQKDLFGIDDPREVLRVTDTQSSLGTTFYRMQQTYEGVDVWGQEMVVSVDRNGMVTGLSGDYIPNIDVSRTGLISAEDAEQLAIQDVGADAQILSTKQYIQADAEGAELVFVVNAIGQEAALQTVIDAQSGVVLDSSAITQYAVPYQYTGEGLDGEQHQITMEAYQESIATRYRFVDAERNIEICDADDLDVVSAILLSAVALDKKPILGTMNNGRFVYGDDTDVDKATIKNAVTTMDSFADIYDYYLNVLGRDSYDGKGGKIKVNINVNDSFWSSDDFDNAAWFPLNKQIYIGAYQGISYSTEKMVLAHEFTHGVIQHTANFKSPTKKTQKFKANETGALSEAYSDILGILATNTSFKVGESALFYEAIRRDLTDPSIFSRPAQMDGLHYYPTSYMNGASVEEYLYKVGWNDFYEYDKGGVHHNATVPGHAAYLMYKGNAFKNKDEMAKVWYQSLHTLFPSATFEDCALNVMKAAKDLGLSESAQAKIREAFVYTRMIDETNFRLAGRVLEENGNCVDRVVVTATNQLNRAVKFVTYTNDLGMYAFKDLPRGTYTINFQKDKYQTKYVTHEADKHYVSLDVTMVKTSKQSAGTTQIVDAYGFQAAVKETNRIMNDRKRSLKVTLEESATYEMSSSFNSNATRVYESNGDIEYYKVWGSMVGISMGLERRYVLHSGSGFTSYYNEGEIVNSKEVWESEWVVSKNFNGLTSERTACAVDFEFIQDSFDMFELKNGAYYLKSEFFQEYLNSVPTGLVQIRELKIGFQDDRVSMFGFSASMLGMVMTYNYTFQYVVAPITIPAAAIAAGQ